MFYVMLVALVLNIIGLVGQLSLHHLFLATLNAAGLTCCLIWMWRQRTFWRK